MNNHGSDMEVNENLKLDITSIELAEPDLHKARLDRLERTKATMKAFDCLVAEETIPQVENRSPKEKAAITIQRHFRGYLGRRLYTELLYEQFEKEEEARREKVLQQVEEGELLLETRNLEILLDDNETTRKNKVRHYYSDVVTIQRAWRAYKRRQSQHDLDMLQRLDSGIDEKMSSSTTADSLLSSREAWGEDMPLLATSVEFSEGYDEDKDTDDTVGHSNSKMPNVPLLALVNKKAPDSECESDYSEVSEPVRDNLIHDHIHNKQVVDVDSSPRHLSPSADETEEEFAKRVRKMNFLSLAQEFAELKKVTPDALPFDLHKGKDASPSSESSGSASSRQSASVTPCDMDKPITGVNTTDSRPNTVKQAWAKEASANKSACGDLIDFDSDCSHGVKKTTRLGTELSSAAQDMASKFESAKLESLDQFDVYNVETALPKMDWKALEVQLLRAAEEEENRKVARKNDREEIRRKLAAGFDEEYYGGERAMKKPNLQTRLQGGTNLQICFMNETSSDGDSSDADGLSRSPRLGVPSLPQRANPFQKESPVRTDTLSDSVGEGHNTMTTPASSEEDTKPRSDTGSSGTTEDEDFFARQARLQAEARLALAQARPMAKMQLEIEKQQKKKSSVAEQVIFADGKRKKLSRAELNVMNLAQLQVLVNDIHTQIETLNEDLVKMLVLRDDLHMEQDSMLVDIEDLTRRAQELAAKVNDLSSTKSEKDKSNKKQKNRRKIFS